MSEIGDQYQQIITKCWADDAFKQRLLADPAGTLKKEGVDVPAGVTVKVVENTAQVINLVIPVVPTGIPDAALDTASGGGAKCNTFSDYVKY